MKVSVLCENHTQDQYIVKPVVTAALAHLGKPHATVAVRPLGASERGIQQLRTRLCAHLRRWGGVSTVVIFVADADCQDGQAGRPDRRAQLTSAVNECDRHTEKAIVLVAIQEAEVWALWGVRDELGAGWPDVRAECDPKERFFERHLDEGITPDGGRTALMKRALRSGWPSLRDACPELQIFEAELSALL